MCNTGGPKRFPDDIGNVFSFSVFYKIILFYFIYIGMKRGAAKLRWAWGGGGGCATVLFNRKQCVTDYHSYGTQRPGHYRTVTHILGI
jgi:hypothetical protein